jgi:hypothetical protein
MATAKKSSGKKAPAKESTAKKSTAKKSPAKKSAAKTASHKTAHKKSAKKSTRPAKQANHCWPGFEPVPARRKGKLQAEGKADGGREEGGCTRRGSA